MNLIQVLVQVLLVFGSKHAKSNEISAVLSVLVAVSEALMRELHSRDSLGVLPNEPRQFHPGVLDSLSELAASHEPKKAVKPSRGRKVAKKLN